jgi:tetratricopeptide (TPR) repeat protein
MYAPDGERDAAEESLREWAERSPGFVHYWYLARYYRHVGRDADALAALREAATHPLEQVDDDAGRVPHWFAFDAAAYACRQKQPELVLALCDTWARPQGVYNYPSPDLPAFRAAALLALGRSSEATTEFNKVRQESQRRAIWAGNLDALEAAIDRNDASFVYDPGSPYPGFMDWSPFPRPELTPLTK